MRIVGVDGLSDEMLLKSAIDVADGEGLDLVEVSTKDGVSICKLMDYSKYLYDQKKKDKSNQSKREITKEIKFSPSIAEHDLRVKVNAALSNLKNDCKIKVIVMFKGREVSRIKDGKELLEQFLSILPDDISILKPPMIEGRNYIMEIKQGK